MAAPAAIAASPDLASPELAKAALSCAPLAPALALAGWVGQGRTLTESGVLRPAEAAQACRDLGIELARPRLRSALDVDELMRAWDTALAAGFLCIEGRRVWAAPDLPEADSSVRSDPEAILGAWVQAATIFLDLDEGPCHACMTVLHALHTAGHLTMEQLAGAVRELELGYQEGDEVDVAEHAVHTVLTMLEFAAATTVDEAVRLTPLGAFLAESVFGQRARPPDASAATMVSAIADVPVAVALTIGQSWLGARSASGAVRELLAFAEAAGGGERVAAVALAIGLGPDADDAWREWAKRPGFGAYARICLRSRGESVTEDPADEAWLIVDELCVMLDSLAEEVPPYWLHAIVTQRLADDVADAAGMMLRSGHSRAAEVVAKLDGRPVVVVISDPALAGHGQPARSPERRWSSEPGMRVYQLKITLRGVSEPQVWRRVLVPAGIKLNDLHRLIQRAMGWEDDHLYFFSAGKQDYGPSGQDFGHASDEKVCVSDVLARRGSRLCYTYDFGDEWEHDVVVEESRIAAPGETYPVCVAGTGACPPEDCGGPWRYDYIKEIMADPSHEEHLDMLDWLCLDNGEDFDPNEFSVGDVNSRLGL